MRAYLKAAAGRAFAELFLACWRFGVPALERFDRATGTWLDRLIDRAQGRKGDGRADQA